MKITKDQKEKFRREIYAIEKDIDRIVQLKILSLML